MNFSKMQASFSILVIASATSQAVSSVYQKILPCAPGSYHDPNCYSTCFSCPSGTAAGAELNDRMFKLDDSASMINAKFANFGEQQPEGNGILYFDGVDDFVELEPWEFGGGEFSVEVNIKFESIEGYKFIFDFANTIGGAQRIAMSTSGTVLNVLVNEKDEEMLREITSSGQNFFRAGEWVHVVWSVSSAGVSAIYRNGQREDIRSGPSTTQLPRRLKRTNHIIGKGSKENLGFFHGAIQSIGFYDHALVPGDHLAPPSTIFNIGLIGAIGLESGCVACPIVPNCSAVKCAANTYAHHFTELNGLLCPPCVPNTDGSGDAYYVECNTCPTGGCEFETKIQLGFYETLSFLVTVGCIACFKVWMRFRRRRHSKITATQQSANQDESDGKQTTPNWRVALNAVDRSGSTIMLKWASLRFEENELETLYTEDVWRTERAAAQQLVNTVLKMLGTMISFVVLFFWAINGSFSRNFALLGTFGLFALFAIERLLAVVTVKWFQVVMVGFQATAFVAAIASTAMQANLAFRALNYVAVTQPATILFMVSSSSVFKLQWAFSSISCAIFGVVVYLLSVLHVGNGGLGMDLSYYHFLFEPPMVIMVAIIVPQTLRQTDIARRTAWAGGWLKAQTLEKQRSKIKSQKQAIDIAEANNMRMKEQLIAAESTIASVMKDSKMLLKQYEILGSDIARGNCSIIGEGSFGSVFKGTLRGSTTVAIKTMRVSKITKAEVEKFKSELMIMCPLHHANLIRLYGGVWNEGADKLCIVLEYAPHGSIKTYLSKNAGTWEGLRYGLALGIARCLRYLHHELTEPLIHRDIKPDNILVGDGVIAKVADFGESTLFDANKARKQEEEDMEGRGSGGGVLTMTIVGTKYYCAPEISLGQKVYKLRFYLTCINFGGVRIKRYNESVDTFSFALVLLCLVAGDINYVAELHMRQSCKYEFGMLPPIPDKVREEMPSMVKLIGAMWQRNLHLRPSMKEVCEKLVSLAPSTISNAEHTN